MQLAPRDSRMKIGLFLLVSLMALQIVISMIYIAMMFASQGCHSQDCYPLRFLSHNLWPLHIVTLPLNIILLGLSLHYARRWPQKIMVWIVPYFSCFTLPVGILSLVWIL